jgi:CelD/BcsL family acetyltransferase involved in cellulose biosynthesis
MRILGQLSFKHDTAAPFLEGDVIKSKDDSLALRTIRDLDDLETLRCIWKSWPGTRDSDPDFFYSIVRSRGEGCTPHVVVLARHGRPDAILVGLRERRKMPFKLGCFTIWQPELNVMEFVCGALRGNASYENTAALVREVIRSLNAGDSDLALWDGLDVQSALYNCALQLPSFALRDHSRRLNDHWWLGHFPEALDALFMSKGRCQSSKLRRKYKNVLNRLAGEVQIRCFRSPADLGPAIADIEEIARKTDKRRAFGVGFFDTPQIRQQMDLTAENGWLRIYILYIKEKPVAFWMGTLYDGCLQGDHVGYDAIWGKFSPGIFLFLNILNDLRDEDIKTVDVGCGHGQLQQCFGDLRRVESQVQIYAPTMRGIELNLLRTTTYRVTQCAKLFLRRTHCAWARKALWNEVACQRDVRPELMCAERAGIPVALRSSPSRRM